MSTKFSQGRVFYAGETVTCTITFTNSLPTLPAPLTNSSSANSHRRRSSVRTSSSYTSRMQSPTVMSQTSSPLVKHGKQFNNGQHSRSQSLTLTSDNISHNDSTSFSKSSPSHRRTGSTKQSSLVYEDEDASLNRKTASFTDLASSTFAYFTGFSINGNQDQKSQEHEDNRNVEGDRFAELGE